MFLLCAPLFLSLSLSLWQPHPDEGTWRCWATACSIGSVELSPGCQCSGIQYRSRRPRPSTHTSLFLLLSAVQKQHSAMYVVAVDHRLTAAAVIHCPVFCELLCKSVESVVGKICGQLFQAIKFFFLSDFFEMQLLRDSYRNKIWYE